MADGCENRRGCHIPAPENIANHDFQVQAAQEKWLTDITECDIRAGKVYLPPTIGCNLRPGYQLGHKHQTRGDLANTMLDAALETIADSGARPIIHSDRGG